jgi:dTDP-glucose pyrophosphorylase
MDNFQAHIIADRFSIRQALARLDQIAVKDNVLFIVDENGVLKGTISDGDIRRGLLKDLDVNALAIQAARQNFRFVQFEEGASYTEAIKQFKKQGIRLVPLVDKDFKLIEIIDAEIYKENWPVDVFLMAGGKGERLMPLTKDCPKPMLLIGNKPIIEHNIDRLVAIGAKNFTLSINYLGQQLIDYFGDGQAKNVTIAYVQESQPLGTLGSISLATGFRHDTVLVMNSDLLTDMDFEGFFNEFVSTNADMCVASTPYDVDIPYAVFDMAVGNQIRGLQEKPKFTYYANAGIYLLKKSALNLVPYNQYYNATDLIEAIIAKGGSVLSYPILSYWLDIGKMPDFIKAQEDIKHLKL